MTTLRGQKRPDPAFPTRSDRRLASATLHMVGLALVFASVGLGVSAMVEWGAGDPAVSPLAGSAALVGFGGAMLWRVTRTPARVPPASAFAAVGWTWVAISLAGALPFWWSGMLGLGDAVFESVSGFTATGATVVSPIEGNGRGILLWRQATQWYGGMGFVVLAVAVLPLLGVGGYELMRAEGPGPTSDRLAPRVRQTAQRLWFVYLALTALIVAALLAAGMAPYDAVAHAFTAVATGGFSPYDASINAFDSVAVELVLIVSMIVGAISFTLWWQLVRGGGPRRFFRSSELRTFLVLLGGGVAAVVMILVADGMAPASALRGGGFTVVSIMTTTGFGTADYVLWPAASQLILLAFMVTGAMAGSTSGAMKLFRVQVMTAHARRELRRVMHPRAVLPVKLGGHVVPEDIIQRIIGFVVLYVVLAILGTVVLAALGTELVTAAGTIATAMGGVGPALGALLGRGVRADGVPVEPLGKRSLGSD